MCQAPCLAFWPWLVLFDPQNKPVRYVLFLLSSLGVIARSSSLIKGLESMVTPCSNQIIHSNKVFLAVLRGYSLNIFD